MRKNEGIKRIIIFESDKIKINNNEINNVVIRIIFRIGMRDFPL